MNMQINPKEFARPQPSQIAQLIYNYTELDVKMKISSGLSDEAMDALVDAQSAFGEAVCDTPARNSKDVAAKFRFLAYLIEDDEGGMLNLEPELLYSACSEIAKLRSEQWKGPDRAYFEAGFPFYSSLLIEAAT